MHIEIVLTSLIAAASFAVGIVQDIKPYVYIEKGKAVATNFTTIPSVSKIQCVRQCFKERKNNRCTIAGYNEVTKACQIGWGKQDDLITVADNEAEVYHFSEGKIKRFARVVLLGVLSLNLQAGISELRSLFLFDYMNFLSIFQYSNNKKN